MDATHPHSHPSSPSTERLRRAGYKITQARLLVLEAIEQLGGHVTSAQVLERVAALDASIGRASVFRTLELLTRLGIIRPTFLESSSTPQYILMPDGHHHHLVCTHCNRVIEFDACNVSDIAAKLEAEFGFHISGHLLEFYGVCAACVQQQTGGN